MQAQPDIDKATQRVEEKLGFYVHLVIYVLVNAILTTLNFINSPDKLWFYWPLMGWGIGVIFHAFRVFSSKSTPKFKQKMIDKELEKIDSEKAE